MKRYIILWLCLAGLACSGQQSSLTLDSCYRAARSHYPQARQKGLLEESTGLKIQNLNRNYLPQMSLNGSTTYQSDVTKIDINVPIPGFDINTPDLNRDSYKLTLDVNQVIWDGGVTGNQKKVESLGLQIDQEALEVDIHLLKERVNQLFFGIILLRENKNLLVSAKERLDKKHQETLSAIRNGTALTSQGNLLMAEILKVEQQVAETEIDLAASAQMLSELTGLTIPADISLEMPSYLTAAIAFQNQRWEGKLLSSQQEKLIASEKLVTTKLMPRFFAFGQLGYGRPGFNFMDNDFTPFYIFGAKVSWTFWNWNQNKHEKRILGLQRQILDTRKETFDQNLRLAYYKDMSEIRKLEDVLEKDRQIIQLREEISRTTTSQYDNGVIAASDLVSRLNEETQARLQYRLHQVQLAKLRQTCLVNLGIK